MTTASSRASSSLLLAALALASCTDEEQGLRGTTTLRVEITSTPQPDCAKTISVEVTALDQDSQPDPSVDGSLDVYAQFLDTLTPDPAKGKSLATLTMADGHASGSVCLAYAFGPTVLWVEDTRDADATYATGVSDSIAFPAPFLVDSARPISERRSDALESSPLEGKQVEITASQHGAGGNLIVTGVYAQGYTVSDVRASDRTAEDYAHGFIFTFGRPRATQGDDNVGIEVGHIIKDVSGGVSEFNGLTEFNFPTTELTLDEADPSRVPDPVPLLAEWLDFRVPVVDADPENPMIHLERLESALVSIEGTICTADTSPMGSFTRFGQFPVDVGRGCGQKVAYNAVTRGQVSQFDPLVHVGEKYRFVGTLRAVNIGAFHVWIVQPRSIDDIVKLP